MSDALRGHLAMLLASALIAGSFPIGAAAANDIAPMALNAVRFVVAACVIGIAMVLTGGASRGAWAAPWRYAVLGGVFAIYFVLMFEGLKTAAPVSAAAVFTLTPIITAGFGWALLGQVATGRILVALALGAAGALWVIFSGGAEGAGLGRGEAVYLVGCVAHALYTPLVRKLNRGERAIVFSFGTLVAGAVLLIVLGAPALAATDWGALPPRVWIAILYTAVAASAATFVLLQFATLRLPSSKVMAYTYLVPSWVIVWTLALGGGGPPAVQLVGVAVTVGALALLLRDG
ncbi:DMT family transporter [Jannaschia formosa]|uniref:DMT family transporter n=1 Tax=Jannaschia formosa TaxID=2259592 RepID=UPI000E1B9A5F|nr:DMT family transporter [Jannaschia formosa]TFL20130.1 DMT family transporter [Jannaschia formosa]